jgi:hypothetical protein
VETSTVDDYTKETVYDAIRKEYSLAEQLESWYNKNEMNSFANINCIEKQIMLDKGLVKGRRSL